MENQNPFAKASAVLTPRGVPLIPIRIYDKGPRIPGWQKKATTDPEQIAAWADPRWKFNAGAVARDNGVCILDIDDTSLLAEMPPVPPTFEVKSGGKGSPHYYFSQTPLSRALGNRQGRVPDGLDSEGRQKYRTTFDFQQNDKQCVAPFSIHASGRIYQVTNDAPFAPIPDELCAWIASKSEDQNSPAPDFKKGEGLWVGGCDITPDQFETYFDEDHHNVPLDDRVRLKTRWMWIVGRCPWEFMHTNPNGEKDFAVLLDDFRGPQIKCCHSSCGKHWSDYRKYLIEQSGQDYSMKTGEKIEPETQKLGEIGISLAWMKLS